MATIEYLRKEIMRFRKQAEESEEEAAQMLKESLYLKQVRAWAVQSHAQRQCRASINQCGRLDTLHPSSLVPGHGGSYGCSVLRRNERG